MIDLTTEESGQALRRIAEVVGFGSRKCAWALDTFGDVHRAMVALVTPEHVDRTRAGFAMLKANPHTAHLAESWGEAVVRLEHLVGERSPSMPEPPRDLTGFLLERLGLERDDDPQSVRSRKMGVRPTHVLVAKHRGGRPNAVIADAAAIVADVFPIGAGGWTPMTRDDAIEHAGRAIGAHLVFESQRYRSREAAEARIARFLGCFERDAMIYGNGIGDGSRRTFLRFTFASFEYGMAVVDRHRVGIIVRTGED